MPLSAKDLYIPLHSIPLHTNSITAPGIGAAYLSVEEKISLLEMLVTGLERSDSSRNHQNLCIPPVPHVCRAVHKNVLHWFLVFVIRMVIEDCLYAREKGLDAVGRINVPSLGTAKGRPMKWVLQMDIPKRTCGKGTLKSNFFYSPNLKWLCCSFSISGLKLTLSTSGYCTAWDSYKGRKWLFWIEKAPKL